MPSSPPAHSRKLPGPPFRGFDSLRGESRIPPTICRAAACRTDSRMFTALAVVAAHATTSSRPDIPGEQKPEALLDGDEPVRGSSSEWRSRAARPLGCIVNPFRIWCLSSANPGVPNGGQFATDAIAYTQNNMLTRGYCDTQFISSKVCLICMDAPWPLPLGKPYPHSTHSLATKMNTAEVTVTDHRPEANRSLQCQTLVWKRPPDEQTLLSRLRSTVNGPHVAVTNLGGLPRLPAGLMENTLCAWANSNPTQTCPRLGRATPGHRPLRQKPGRRTLSYPFANWKTPRIQNKTNRARSQHMAARRLRNLHPSARTAPLSVCVGRQPTSGRNRQSHWRR